MTLFQVLAVLFSLWMMFEIFIHGKRKILTPVEIGVWLSMWGLFIIIALFPGLLLGITQRLSFARVFDLLVVGTFIILSILVFVSYFAQKEMNQRLTKLVEDLALKDGKAQKSTEKAKRG